MPTKKVSGDEYLLRRLKKFGPFRVGYACTPVSDRVTFYWLETVPVAVLVRELKWPSRPAAGWKRTTIRLSLNCDATIQRVRHTAVLMQDVQKMYAMLEAGTVRKVHYKEPTPL